MDSGNTGTAAGAGMVAVMVASWAGQVPGAGLRGRCRSGLCGLLG